MYLYVVKVQSLSISRELERGLTFKTVTVQCIFVRYSVVKAQPWFRLDFFYMTVTVQFLVRYSVVKVQPWSRLDYLKTK
jgi:hypothetical protein